MFFQFLKKRKLLFLGCWIFIEFCLVRELEFREINKSHYQINVYSRHSCRELSVCIFILLGQLSSSICFIDRPIEQSKFVLNVKRIIFVIYDSLGFKVILYDWIVIWFGNKFEVYKLYLFRLRQFHFNRVVYTYFEHTLLIGDVLVQ